jgi:predicted nuclease of predicted toxin-antitoxin system
VKFKIDENLPAEVAALLRDRGFDAHTVNDERLLGAKNAVIAEVACRERRVLMTLDRDFSDIRAYPPAGQPGIIVLRPRRQDKQLVIELVRRFILILEYESPEGELWIVEPDRIRRRS